MKITSFKDDKSDYLLLRIGVSTLFYLDTKYMDGSCTANYGSEGNKEDELDYYDKVIAVICCQFSQYVDIVAHLVRSVDILAVSFNSAAPSMDEAMYINFVRTLPSIK